MSVKWRACFYLLLMCAVLQAKRGWCQGDLDGFRRQQMGASRVQDAWKKYNDSAAREFKRVGLAYPCKDIYLRAFKSQNEMELWARNNENSEYRLVKTMHICAISGALGPKRAEGDRQVPEGYYFIDDFNEASDYHLSMQVSYPNPTDQAQGKGRLGGNIFIHGGCVTVGCMPMTNDGIQELYVVCLNAYLNGQENIPVHIFPTRLTRNGMAYLARQFANDRARMQFWNELKPGFEYFEKYHKLWPVMYTADGRYANP